MAKRLGILALILFFLGFPVAGLLYFWNDAHKKVEASALTFANTTLDPAVKAWDYAALDAVSLKSMRDDMPEAAFNEHKARIGPPKGEIIWTVDKSWANEEEGEVWQFATVVGRGTFERKGATITATLGRRTLVPKWRIRSLQID